MENIRKKTALILLLSLTIGVLAGPVPVRAAAEDRSAGCAVIGEDLTNAQTQTVYDTFGFPRGTVREVLISNAEERSLLEGFAEDERIGTACCGVYMEPLPPGSGTEITTGNVTLCTGEMYRSALATAGIEDVRAMIAAPFAVSGITALPALYKAWETLTGETLDDTAQQVGLRELIAAADLAEDVGQGNAADLLEKIRSALSRTADMTDAELDARIRELGEQYGITLNDQQVRQIMDLCRGMEKLSDNRLTEAVDDLRATAEKIEEYTEKTEELRENVSSFAQTLKDFFSKAADFFSGLFGKK